MDIDENAPAQSQPPIDSRTHFAGEPIRGLSQPLSVPSSKAGAGWRILWAIVTAISILANIGLLFAIIGIVMVFAVGQTSSLHETVLREGPAGTKIAVICVEGIIDGDLAEAVRMQLEAAERDNRVKAIIVRVSSPGGTLSGSDEIHNELGRFRQRHGKPMIAFMQGVAASGGYYVSVACEKIVAEPTAITGSIGVISWYLVVQELLENKLGVLPVTFKSGQKKDWPSSFRAPTPEEIDYMDKRLIQPAFERFVDVVAAGRQAVLTRDDVRAIADGSIYVAQQAVDKKLIDAVGYLDDAIEAVKSLAGIDKARVVEYRKPFSLADFLSLKADSMLKVDKATLYKLTAPQVLYLWPGY